MNTNNISGNGIPVPARTEFPQDNIQAVRPTFRYEGQTRTIEEFPVSTREIDGAVIVSSNVDGRTRQEALQSLQHAKHAATLVKEKNESKSVLNVIEISSGIAVTGLSITAGIISAFALPVLIVAGGIAGVAVAADGIRRYCNSSAMIDSASADIQQLQGQQMDWQDPLPGIVEERKQAGRQGFDYVLNKNLKGTVIHPDEVKQFWTESFQQLCQNHSDIDRVYQQNLLGSRAMSYAMGNSFPMPIATPVGYYTTEAINRAVNHFSQWREAYTIALGHRDNALHSINSQKMQIEKQIFDMKEKWMLPAIRTHQMGRENAEHHYRSSLQHYRRERDNAIEDAKRQYAYCVNDPLDTEEVAFKLSLDRALSDTICAINQKYKNHPELRQIKDAYAYDMKMHDFMFLQSKGMVNAYFDNKKRQLRQEADLAEAQIQSQYQAVRSQLKDLLHRVLDPQNQGFVGPRDFSYPPLVQSWRFSDYSSEPSWNHIYGSRPHYRPDFSVNVTMADWNYYWGNHGLGAFETRPVHCWNDITREHLFMPRYPVRPAPARGFFSHPVNVPRFVRNPAPRVVPGTHTSTSFGTTTRREGVPLPVHVPSPVMHPAPRPVHVPPPVVNPAPRVIPGTHTSTSFGTTTHRVERPQPPAPAPRPVHVPPPPPVVNSAPRVIPGTHTSTSFGTTTHRVERPQPPAPAPRPAPVVPVREVRPAQPAPASDVKRTLPGNRTSAALGGVRRR